MQLSLLCSSFSCLFYQSEIIFIYYDMVEICFFFQYLIIINLFLKKIRMIIAGDILQNSVSSNDLLIEKYFI